MQLSLTGEQKLVEYLGSSMNDKPAALVYSNQKAKLFATTNSIQFQNQGGMDWLLLDLDQWGINQCTALGITKTSDLSFKDA